MRKLYKTSDTQNIMYKEFEQNDCTEKWLHACQAGGVSGTHAHCTLYRLLNVRNSLLEGAVMRESAEEGKFLPSVRRGADSLSEGIRGLWLD